jgi:hypothetical protein
MAHEQDHPVEKILSNTMGIDQHDSMTINSHANAGMYFMVSVAVANW